MNQSKNWTKQQQEYLKMLKEELKMKNWVKMSQELNKKFQNKEKNGKQCRQRYINFIRSGLNDEDQNIWTWEEENILYEKYLQFGPKWTLLCTFISSKSENCIKNKFYGTLRKFLRKLNEAGKNVMIAKKLIKYQSILRPLENQGIQIQKYPGFYRESQDLRRQLIEQIKNKSDLIDIQKAKQLINKIHKFNLETKSMKIKNKKIERQTLIELQKHQSSSQTTRKNFLESIQEEEENIQITIKDKKKIDSSPKQSGIFKSDQSPELIDYNMLEAQVDKDKFNINQDQFNRLLEPSYGSYEYC